MKSQAQILKEQESIKKQFIKSRKNEFLTDDAIAKYYRVLEVPIIESEKSIRMELEELKRFCIENDQPLFYLRVEEITEIGIRRPVEKPYMRYFVRFQDLMLIASGKIDAINSVLPGIAAGAPQQDRKELPDPYLDGFTGRD